MKRKIIAGILTLGLFLSAVACGKENTEASSETEKKAEPEEVVVEEVEEEPEDVEYDAIAQPIPIALRNIEHRGGAIYTARVYDFYPELYGEDALQYEKLNESLISYEEISREMDENLLSNLVEAAEEEAEYSDDYTEYYSKTTAAVLRSDNRIISIQKKYQLGTGLDSDVVGFGAINFNPVTGDILGIEDVVKDSDAFLALVQERFEEMTASEEELLSYLENRFSGESTEDDVRFSVSNLGLTLYFEPYEMEAYTVSFDSMDFYFDEYPEIFNDIYLETVEEYFVPVELEKELKLDVDFDGEIDSLMLTPEIREQDADTTYYPVLHTDYVLSVNENTDTIEDMEDREAYLVHKKDVTYLFFPGVMESDEFKEGLIYNLTMMEPIEEYHSWFPVGYDFLFATQEDDDYQMEEILYPLIDPNEFYLTDYSYICGTNLIRRVYMIDENGIPTEKSSYGIINTTSTLKLKEDVTAILIDSEGNEGEEVVLSAKSLVRYVGTDGNSFVDFQIVEKENKDSEDDNPIYRVYFTNENYSYYTQDGVLDTDAFDGIIYAN